MEIKVKNHLGQIMEIDPLKYPVVNASGLTPASATVNTSNIASVDGTFFNSAATNQRNIVLTITPNIEAEKARLFLYQYFKPKYPLTLYFKTKYREVYIDGYVETFEGGLYEQKQSFQISVICPQPFFVDVNTDIITQTKVVDNFTFPFFTPASGITLSSIITLEGGAIMNKGEETTGAVIEMSARGTVLEPTVYNRTTGEKFTVQVELQAGDLVRIDTRRGEKSVVLLSHGETTNILNRITQDSKWLTLPAGENIFTFACAYGDTNLDVIYHVSALYEGV